MSPVLASYSISLDGFVAGPDVRPGQPMGRGGKRLHQWLYTPTPIESELSAATTAGVGAVVLGRRTFDIGLEEWEDTPYPVPSYVVTHRPRGPLVMPSSQFLFCDDLAGAVDDARRAADGRTVVIMGASVVQQALGLGLVDELELQTVPLLLGAGTPLFNGTEVELERIRAHVTPQTVTVRYRVPRG